MQAELVLQQIFLQWNITWNVCLYWCMDRTSDHRLFAHPGKLVIASVLGIGIMIVESTQIPDHAWPLYQGMLLHDRLVRFSSYDNKAVKIVTPLELWRLAEECAYPRFVRCHTEQWRTEIRFNNVTDYISQMLLDRGTKWKNPWRGVHLEQNPF